MKITKEQLKTLIREEASKIRKEMAINKEKSSKKLKLENRKVEIASQLNEMYGEDVQEIFGLEKTKVGQALGMKTPEQKAENAKKLIMGHKTWKNAPAKWAKQYGITPEAAMEQLVNIVAVEGGLPTSVKWDAAKKQMVNATLYKASGGSGGVNPTHEGVTKKKKKIIFEGDEKNEIIVQKIVSGIPLSKEELTVDGSLNFLRKNVKTLPDNLTVNGSVNLHGGPIERLPSGLKVRGELRIQRTSIETLPDNLEVGVLDAQGTLITSFPSGVRVKYDIKLAATPIKSLPYGLQVGGSLGLNGTPIKTLPDGLRVEGEFFANNSQIESLPNGLYVGWSIHLAEAPISSLPSGLRVDKNLFLMGTAITSLPEDLQVGGNVYLLRTPMASDVLKKGFTDEGYIEANRIKAMTPGVKGKIYFLDDNE